MSHACNDFIIKDNKFVRQFEKMYKSIDDPWDQEKLAHTEIEKIINSIKSIHNLKPLKYIRYWLRNWIYI